jgi:hypothetical protein
LLGTESFGCNCFVVTSDWVGGENAIWAMAGAPDLVYWNGVEWAESFSGLNGPHPQAV